ncbi:MAG TPA: phosphotransferase [Nocardioidaceae bacterium]|nr:phosphotransferase [Nocardioidaceae bacterium]
MVADPGSEMDNGACCVIITGPPAAGKTTVSRLVAQGLRRSARLDGDVINELIVSGRVWALGEPADEAAHQVRLCNENLCALAANFADYGFTPVIDSVIPDRTQLDFFMDALSPRRVLLVVLAPGIDVCRYRNTIRHHDEQFFFDDYAGLSAAMHGGFANVGWWLDTSTLTAGETARQILADAVTYAGAGA